MIKTPEQKLTRNPQNAGYTNPLKSYDVPAKDNPDGTINVHSQPVYGIDPNHEPIDLYMACRTVPGGTVRWTRDATADDSDKSFTVPAGRVWQIISVTVEILATATVGNRNLAITISDGTALVWTSALTGNIAAAQYGGIFLDNGGRGMTTGVVRMRIAGGNFAENVTLEGFIPPYRLPGGYIIRAYDIAAVDVAADDMTVIINYLDLDP